MRLKHTTQDYITTMQVWGWINGYNIILKMLREKIELSLKKLSVLKIFDIAVLILRLNINFLSNLNRRNIISSWSCICSVPKNMWSLVSIRSFPNVIDKVLLTLKENRVIWVHSWNLVKQNYIYKSDCNIFRLEQFLSWCRQTEKIMLQSKNGRCHWLEL